MGFRKCINDEELDVGDRVLIISPDNGIHVPNNYYDYFFEKQVYGVVHSEKKHRAYCCNGSSVLVDFAQSTKFLDKVNVHTHVRDLSLRKLKPKEYEKYERLALEADKWAKAHIKSQQALLKLEPAKDNYMNRMFRFEDREVLHTGVNVVGMGSWNHKAGNFNISENYYLESCCAFTQCDDDMEVYIPDIWMRYYGYTPFDLVEWCKFLSKCGIDFEYEYLGAKSLPRSFDDKIDDVGGDFVNNFTVGRHGSVIYPDGKEGYLVVRVSGSDTNMHTYLKFLCLRYMYNHHYWTIPGHAMQIKNTLGDLVSYWEALLLAHLYKDYYNYYSLASQFDLKLDEEHFINKYSKFGSDNNYNRHIDPFQDRNTVLENLDDEDAGMNASFDYVCDAFSRKELRKFFDDKDYIGLYNYAKEKIADAKTWRLKGKG